MRGLKHEKGGVERPNIARGEAECCIAARDHGLRVLYSAGTARTKRAITNLLFWVGASGTAPSLSLRLPFERF